MGRKKQSAETNRPAQYDVQMIRDFIRQILLELSVLRDREILNESELYWLKSDEQELEELISRYQARLLADVEIRKGRSYIHDDVLSAFQTALLERRQRQLDAFRGNCGSLIDDALEGVNHPLDLERRCISIRITELLRLASSDGFDGFDPSTDKMNLLETPSGRRAVEACTPINVAVERELKQASSQGALAQELGSIDGDGARARVYLAWPRLPPNIQRAMLALIGY